jgi:hypothetical protein
MNRLQNNRLQPGQTMLNLVNHGQKEPIRFGPLLLDRFQKAGMRPHPAGADFPGWQMEAARLSLAGVV